METNIQKNLSDLFLDLGEAMLGAGAEISRVEDSLSRLGKTYGAVRTDVFAITSSIVLTLAFQNGESITGTRRISGDGGQDFAKLHSLNSLCRRCSQMKYSPLELKEEMEKICARQPRKLKLYLGSALAAGSFSVFFGGTAFDGIVSALIGLLVCFMQIHLSPKCPNKAFFLFLSSLACGSGIYLLGHPLPFLHTDLVVIGDIMLLVPGIAITTAVRDMVIGDTISGFTRFAECLLWAGALAAGFMGALMLFGGAV